MVRMWGVNVITEQCAYCACKSVLHQFTCNDGIDSWVAYACDEHLDIAYTQLYGSDITYEVQPV